MPKLEYIIGNYTQTNLRPPYAKSKNITSQVKLNGMVIHGITQASHKHIITNNAYYCTSNLHDS